jgi:hypothetical protein
VQGWSVLDEKFFTPNHLENQRLVENLPHSRHNASSYYVLPVSAMTERHRRYFDPGRSEKVLNSQAARGIRQRINVMIVHFFTPMQDGPESITSRVMTLFGGAGLGSAGLALVFWGAVLLTSAPAWAQREVSPVDLTDLVRSAPDENFSADDIPGTVQPRTGTEDGVEPAGSSPFTEQNNNSVSPVAPSSSTSESGSPDRKDPASIRLDSLGLDRRAVDGLDRRMWDGSDAQAVLALMTSLDPARSSRALRPVLNHVMTARAVPPEGFINIAPQIINAKLNWLAASGVSDDLADIIRQLPDTAEWEDRQAWLILHDLMVRNDGDACGTAQRKVSVTLDALWHQVNAFCGVINNQVIPASFALDILEDSGIEDPLYFSLMRHLLNKDDLIIDDQTDISILNLILMDSARIFIDADGIGGVPQSYNESVTRLRYLSPEAIRLIGARSFGAVPVEELTLSWALLPGEDISSAEALTILRSGGDDDTVATSRFNAWHAISQEKDKINAASLAFEAMVADYNHSGIESIGLWLPIIEGGVNFPEIDSKIGPLIGFGSAPPKILMNDVAQAWHDLLTPSRQPLSDETVAVAEAYDVIPLLMALGRPVANPNRFRDDVDARGLAVEAISVPVAQMAQIEQAAEKGLKAETLLRVAQLLQDQDITTLSGDDAARLIAVLMRVDLKDTAQRLAHDILITWGMNRHLNRLTDQVQES